MMKMNTFFPERVAYKIKSMVVFSIQFGCNYMLLLIKFTASFVTPYSLRASPKICTLLSQKKCNM